MPHFKFVSGWPTWAALAFWLALGGPLARGEEGKEPRPLWEIGRADGGNADFALAPGNYEAFTNDGFYVVGRSKAKEDWPYVQPGPADEWAGGRQHTFSIVFGVKQAAAGTCCLRIDLLDTHHVYPPRLSVEINGRRFERALPPGAGNVSLEGEPGKGKPHRIAIEFPASLLKAGDNRIDIVSTAGSWMLYGRVALDVPAGTEPAPAQIPAASRQPETRSLRIDVDASVVTHTMRGGIGASWHAIRKDLPGPRGSAWGGNPPLDGAAWRRVCESAAWLGLDFVRVEFDQRMYEPQRGQFDWDNEEVQTLDRILGWCQQHGADVFLQQMWSHVEWNACPGVAPLVSAPKSVGDFAEGLATLVERLVKTRGTTCIQWLCITNEPGAWWQGSPSITPALKAVRAALDGRDIALLLSAPDWTDLPGLDPRRIDFDPFVGAYDIHSYQGMDAGRQRILADWAAYAHGRNKPLFLSELGDMRIGWGGSHPGPSTFKAALSNAETVLRGLAAGVDGFNRWSFLNRGDLDGQWQLVRTWDIRKKQFLDEPVPEPPAYYGFAMLTRFVAKHSDVLRCDARPAAPGPAPNVLAAALRSPKGNLTLLLLNRSNAACSVDVSVSGLKSAVRLFRYQITEAAVRQDGFKLAHDKDFPLAAADGRFTDSLPPLSITAFSTYDLAPSDPGITAE